MVKIDAHSHMGNGPASWSGKEIIERMDTIGVDKTIVFPFVEGDYNNEDILQAAEKNPDRLIPFCAVNPWNMDKAAEELEQCFRRGFKGIKLHPALNGYALSNKKLVNPIFELADYYGKVVIAHGASDLYNCPLEFARIARRFPGVPLIMAHCGFFWQWEQAIEVALEHDNLYLETSRVPAYETSQVISKLGGGKVLWGTDGPFCDYEWEYRKIERCSGSDTIFEQVIGGTALGLLGGI